MPPQTVGVSALSVAANATSSDQLSGTLLDRAPSNGVLTIFLKASATGLNAQFSAGTDIILNDQVIPFTGTAGTLSTQDNLVTQVGVRAGAKLSLRFRNTTGGAITVDALVKFDG